MLPGDDFTFGKPNRVQTPVGGIISNLYGEKASDDLQKRYVFQKEMVSGQILLNFQQRTMQKGFGDIRMTNAQMGMDKSIRNKWLEIPQEPSITSFKLKRFTSNIEPRVSTKRGDQPYMLNSQKKGASGSTER